MLHLIFTLRAISESAVIVTTPEKWDGVSRSWQTRNFVQDVALIVIDEIHLLGEATECLNIRDETVLLQARTAAQCWR